MLMSFRKKIDSFYDKKTGIVFVLAFLIFAGLVVSRRPDAVFAPGFYAEDGVFWYTEAYSANHFWQPFLAPKQGYLQTISRFGGLFVQFVDLKYAPLCMNLFAILIQIAPALFFLSKRFENVVKDFSWRFLIAIGYLSLPATFETHANLTNAMWRLSILAFLIIIAVSPRNKIEKFFDYLVLFISGISGPFVFFLFPILLIWEKFSTHKKDIQKIFVLAAAFLIQLSFYLATLFGFFTKDTRSTAPLGASVITFLKLVSGKIFLIGIFGTKFYQKVSDLQIWKDGLLPLILFAIFALVMVQIFRKAQLEIKLFALFALLVFFAGLATPQVTLTDPQWDTMLGARPGNRYFLLPILALFVSLVWLAFENKKKAVRFFGVALLLCFVWGAKRDWTFPRNKNYDFPKQVAEFKALPSGQTYTFQINPGWNMPLVKK